MPLRERVGAVRVHGVGVLVIARSWQSGRRSLESGPGLFATGLAATLLRQGNRTASALLWVFPGVLGLIAVVFFANGAGALGGFYVAAATVAVIGMAVAFRALRGR